MPPRPQTPLRTHSAPPLPAPASVEDTSVSSRVREFGGESGRCCTPFVHGPVAATCQQPACSPRTVKFSPQRRADAACCFASRRRCFLGDVSCTPVTEGKGCVREEVAAARDAAVRRHVPPLPAAPTAYEAALARCGKKLWSFTLRERHARERRSRELRLRQRAVNERYNELSRPATVSSERRASVAHWRCGNTSRRRQSVAADILGDRALRQVKPVASTRHQESGEKTAFAASRGIGYPCRLLSAVAETAGWHQKESKRKKYCFGNANGADSDSVNIEIDIEEKRENKTPCVRSVWSAAARTKPKSLQKTHVEESLFPSRNATLAMCRSKSLDRKLTTSVDDMLNGVRLFVPPCLTPPRPLRRTCGLGSFSHISSKDKRENKSVFKHFFSTDTRPYELGRHGTASVGLCHDRCWSPDLNARRGEAFVFIRPRLEPRPLFRQREWPSRGGEEFWDAQEASFCGSLRADHSDGERPVPDAFASCRHTRKIQSEGPRPTFANLVPKHILDGFAQRHLLRVAWRRWRDRFWKSKLSRLECFKDTSVASRQDDATHLAVVKTWFSELENCEPVLLKEQKEEKGY